MKPDLKLKVVAEEIKEILRKHDVAAVVGLHTIGCGEYFLHLNTSYSCAYIYEDGQIRIYSKEADHESQEEQLEKQSNTSNMLRVLTDSAAFGFAALEPVSEKFDSMIGAIHGDVKMKGDET